MISLTDVYHVVTATVPLYVAMILAYVSMKWWKLFSPEQCSGINKFVAKFSIPLLSFQVISTNNPYKMNLKLVCADFLQKLVAIFVMTVVVKVRNRGNLSCIITGVSLSTLPNTLILGIPILRAMYGDEATGLLSQIVVLQSIVWYNLLLFLFELNKMNESSCLIPPPPAIGGVEGPEGAKPEEDECESEQESRIIHSKNKKIMLILLTVGRKLISNPNTHATALGLMWASIHFRWGVKLPQVLDKSISILSDGGLGMALFSLGLFMAMQKSIIACGIRMAVLATTMKFVVGPALMALSSIAIGIRGTLFRVAILQATLPQGIVPFVFAQEYNIHPEILSAGVIFGMLVSLPVALAYYFLLAVKV